MARRSAPRSFVVLLLLVLLCAAGCLNPKDRRPGLRLTGERVTEPVADWSFTDQHREIFVQTRTRYLLPHSVTIVCASRDGKLYVGARNPDEKRWVQQVARNPEVRLKIGDKLYDVRLAVVEDPAEQRLIGAAYRAKYGWADRPPSERPPMRYYRVLERG